MNEDTAKWSIAERLRLADSMARIEERLKAQDKILSDLLEHAEMAQVSSAATAKDASSLSTRVRMHEKIAGLLFGLASLAVAIWKSI